MTGIQFWGGVGVIGSTKVLIDAGDARVLLDIGLDIPSGVDLFRSPVAERPGHELADRLRVGALPMIDDLYDPAQLAGSCVDMPARGADSASRPTAVFISHGHIDHLGAAGFVRKDIGVHAHADTVRLMRALTAGGDPLPGGDPAWHPLADGQQVRFGSVTVECVPVEHDVPGACGYLVTTPSGTIAYTGDVRWHGPHPEITGRFVERARGADVLVTETTQLSWPDTEATHRSDADVLADVARVIADSPGAPVLLSAYPRDVELAIGLIATAARAGRRIVWPGRHAAVLARMGVPEVCSWDASRPQRPEHLRALETLEASVDLVGLGEVIARPGDFVLHPDARDLPALLDLPISPGTWYVHTGGEPLGDFDPRWAPFVDWLTALDVRLAKLGCSGHATAGDLHRMVGEIAPRVVFPVHGAHPEALVPPPGTTAVLPALGVRYEMSALLG